MACSGTKELLVCSLVKVMLPELKAMQHNYFPISESRLLLLDNFLQTNVQLLTLQLQIKNVAVSEQFIINESLPILPNT